ncbi:hypothetical protein HSX37_16465|uniref:hypothetical protein n=1 Tax=Dendrosporobacter quercicolus TaxID=146817 RepID=UPI0011144D65|nr:hypothetical protein [Dendrosporobacter quercicolus]NSL49630.1 hypothetical protein [Dendrosporobacter quercicolus DSM 1736]
MDWDDRYTIRYCADYSLLVLIFWWCVGYRADSGWDRLYGFCREDAGRFFTADQLLMTIKKPPQSCGGSNRTVTMFSTGGQSCDMQLTNEARQRQSATRGCPAVCPPSVSFLLQQPYNNTAKKFCDGL